MFNKCECIYCKQYNDFPVLWRLTKDILWFEIPKNGSSSVKHTYTNKQHIKDTSQYTDATPYVILRDPVDRFVSLFKHYFLEEGRRFTRSVAFCKRLGVDVNRMNIGERFAFLLDNLEELTTAEEVHHFYPQVSFIDETHFNTFNLLNMSDISKELNIPIMGHTKSNVILNPTDDQLHYIKTIYKDDYTFFHKHGYKT